MRRSDATEAEARADPASLQTIASELVAARLESYRRLADLFHEVLAEQSLDSVLERIADALAELVPYDTLTIYEANEIEGVLKPVLARDEYAEQVLESTAQFGEGITGWAVEHREAVLINEAHLDPRVVFIPGTPPDPEALVSVPLIARGSIKGALNVYRTGEGRGFSHEELALAKRFGDAAALALDNAQSRAALERQAQTDSLTGLFNHRYFHERLRGELRRVSRVVDSLAVVMLDIDDFKRLNDVYGHGVGDHVLIALSDALRDMTRASDVVCRLGGEELAVIMPSCGLEDGIGLAARFRQWLSTMEFAPAGRVTVSIGVAVGPDHAMNPRELAGCAEAAMMTAKARGKDQAVVYQDEVLERPDSGSSGMRNIRSISHLKMLQSLAGKLNRLNDVRAIGLTIAEELASLIDYHNCRVYLAEGDELIPVALLGAYEQENAEDLKCRFGEGITGRAAETGRSLLIDNALECDFAVEIPGTDEIAESMVAVPLTYGTRVIGMIVLSKLGVGQFDDDDVRLMEVLAGNASVALENARLYEAQRREAETAKALLELSDSLANSGSAYAVGRETVRMAARLLGASQSALWMQDDATGDFVCTGHLGYEEDPTAAPLIGLRVPRSDGERFLAHRQGPFVVAPSVARQYFSLPEGTVARTVAVGPLVNIKGWIVVREPDDQERGLTQDSLRLLAGVCYQASVAMQKARLYREQEESAEIANALLEFGRELAGTEGLDDVLNQVARSAAHILGVGLTAVWLEEIETGDFLAHARWGYEGDPGHDVEGLRVPSDVMRELLSGGQPFLARPEMLAPLVSSLPGAERLANDMVYAVAPLNLDGGRVGALTAGALAGDVTEFSDRKMRLLAGIAHQAKIAIASAWNFENLEATFLSTVEALANALEAKDEYTSSHARDITDMALEVGEELELDDKTLKRLELGALFHDIGKIGIPSQILLKPGPLTPDEREVMETHPELGERILAPIARLEDVRPVVRACHERFDGRGYPDGLSGEAIPVESRVIFVCDAFHAMTTDRPYRMALPTDEACRRLVEGAGAQFDPAILEVFLRILRRP